MVDYFGTALMEKSVGVVLLGATAFLSCMILLVIILTEDLSSEEYVMDCILSPILSSAVLSSNKASVVSAGIMPTLLIPVDLTGNQRK